MMNGDDRTQNSGGKQPKRKLGFVFGSIAPMVLLVLMMHVSWHWWQETHGMCVWQAMRDVGRDAAGSGDGLGWRRGCEALSLA